MKKTNIRDNIYEVKQWFPEKEEKREKQTIGKVQEK